MDCISEDEWGDVAVMGERLYRHREHWQGLNGGGFSAEWNFISLKCSGFSGGLYSHSVVSFSCLDIILPIRGEEDFANLNMSHNHHHPPNHMHAQTTSTDTNAYICAHKHARAYTLHACIYAYTYIHARTHVRTRSHPHHTYAGREHTIYGYTH